MNIYSIIYVCILDYHALPPLAKGVARQTSRDSGMMYIVRREVVISFVLISSVVVVYIFTSLCDMSVSGK